MCQGKPGQAYLVACVLVNKVCFYLPVTPYNLFNFVASSDSSFWASEFEPHKVYNDLANNDALIESSWIF